jgi:ribosomal protein S18 acetylase RimI-like enzyme
MVIMNIHSGEVYIRPSKLSDKEILMDMVNEIYGKCEEHMWLANHERLTEGRFEGFHRNKELFIAETCGAMIIGCVVISNIGTDGKGLAMLTVKPEFRGQGIGRKLVDYVINSAREDSCEFVRLELLYPTHQPDPWKQTLRKWYTSLGFKFVRNEDFALYCPEIDHITQEVTFSIFEKPLKCNEIE